MSAKKDWFRWGATVAAVLVIVYSLGYLPTPYVVYKPGLAVDVGPMVHVAEADAAADSVMMLTTVRQLYPNWLLFWYARVHPDWDIYKKSDIFREGESREEYSQRQQYVMLSSQSSAMQAAYRAAEIPYELAYEGVIVLRTIPGMPAADKLRSGDRIVTVNDEKITRSDELISLVSGAAIGDSYTIVVMRGEEAVESEIEIGDFSRLPDSSNGTEKQQPGLGIQLADLIAVRAETASKQVVIQVDDIGGPSAGLIFALEIYDQLTQGDLSRGHRIAGTGEMDTNGTVGAIGGVKHKVVAAHEQQADIFFTPTSNAAEAAAKAKAIGTEMKVVPVANLKSAIDYLEQLPPKGDE